MGRRKIHESGKERQMREQQEKERGSRMGGKVCQSSLMTGIAVVMIIERAASAGPPAGGGRHG